MGRLLKYTDVHRFGYAPITYGHRRRVLFSPGWGWGGWVHIQIPVNWVGGGKHCKLHAFVHICIELEVHDYVYIYMINMHGISCMEFHA